MNELAYCINSIYFCYIWEFVCKIRENLFVTAKLLNIWMTKNIYIPFVLLLQSNCISERYVDPDQNQSVHGLYR